MITKIKHSVFNSTVDDGYLYYPKLTRIQIRELEADLFEQLMLFDRIYLKTGRVNFALIFLIRNFGLIHLERLLDARYIKFLLYTPMIAVDKGRQLDDGTIDETTAFGNPPIISGALDTGANYREEVIDTALNQFPIRSKAKKQLKKKILRNVIQPDGMEFSKEAANIVIDAYNGNLLEDIGMPYSIEADQLEIDQRHKLQGLGLNVLETALLSKYGLKSFNLHNNSKLYKENLNKIGDALKVTDNAVEIFNFEDIPDLRLLFKEQNLSFTQVFKLRHGSTAKYFRNWLNITSENQNVQSITKEYLDEIADRKGFFETKGGKFLKTTGTFGIGAGIAAAIGNPAIAIPATYGLRLLDTFVLQDLIKGKNARMFIDNLRESIE